MFYIALNKPEKKYNQILNLNLMLKLYVGTRLITISVIVL